MVETAAIIIVIMDSLNIQLMLSDRLTGKNNYQNKGFSFLKVSNDMRKIFQDKHFIYHSIRLIVFNLKNYFFHS